MIQLTHLDQDRAGQRESGDPTGRDPGLNPAQNEEESQGPTRVTRVLGDTAREMGGIASRAEPQDAGQGNQDDPGNGVACGWRHGLLFSAGRGRPVPGASPRRLCTVLIQSDRLETRRACLQSARAIPLMDWPNLT